MRVLFAGGGTAGHINPALSVADYMKEKDADFEALFIGTEHGLEKKLVPAAGYKIKYIDIRGFDRKHILRNFAVLYKYLALNRHRTQVFLGTGFSINMLRYEYSFRYTPQNVGPAVQAFDLPVFPFRLEIDYTISNSVRFGLLGGIHFEPDDGFNGKYAGVRLGYLIRQNVREN